MASGWEGFVHMIEHRYNKKKKHIEKQLWGNTIRCQRASDNEKIQDYCKRQFTDRDLQKRIRGSKPTYDEAYKDLITDNTERYLQK